jgi:hypothetical protein
MRMPAHHLRASFALVALFYTYILTASVNPCYLLLISLT